MTSGRGAQARIVRASAVVLAGSAIALWAFAEWLIIGFCFGLGESGCGSREWGGAFMPVQALLALVGAIAAGSTIWSVASRRAFGRPFLLLASTAGAWLLVLAIETSG